MDPYSLSRNNFGYHTDIYGFGMMMLATLTKRTDVADQFRIGEQILLKNDYLALRDFFIGNWEDQVPFLHQY